MNPYNNDQRPLSLQWKRSLARETLVRTFLYTLGSLPLLALMAYAMWAGAK